MAHYFRYKTPADVIADADLKKHWKDLATTAGTTGGHAVWSLMVLDKKALPFLEDRLRISELPNAKMITALIAQLDDEDFAVREDATKSLSKLGKSAAAELRRALSKNPAAETKARLEALLRPLSEDDGDPRLRAQRVLAALEHMTAPDAQKLLEHLADKEVDEDVRRDAAAAVRRIKARVAAQ
ncbi:MAG: hypothetical protein HY289_01075 [Planctomycetes bacterium]|nr:hypothetical protein [Planctomycetota bacterium]